MFHELLGQHKIKELVNNFPTALREPQHGGTVPPCGGKTIKRTSSRLTSLNASPRGGGGSACCVRGPLQEVVVREKRRHVPELIITHTSGEITDSQTGPASRESRLLRKYNGSITLQYKNILNTVQQICAKCNFKKNIFTIPVKQDKLKALSS